MDTEKKLIKSFVSNRYMDEQKSRQSCLVMALETARILSGRDKDSGKSRKNYTSDILKSEFITNNQFGTADNLAGLINYLQLLDLIGNVFISLKDTIYKTLKKYSSITDDKECRTVVALRNCLVHNYGLINIPHNKKNVKSRHKFSLLLNDGTMDMIKIPITRWDGNYADKDKSTNTQIDVCKLIDAIEETYQNLKEKAEKGELKLCLNGGVAELKARFTIIS